MGSEAAADNQAKPPKGQYDVARIPPRMLRGKLAPDSFELDGVTWTRQKHLKADFFAATGCYVAPDGRRVCLKHFHTEPYCLIPLGWAGRYMCRREMRFYRHLAGLEGLPGLVGQVGPSAFAHEWIEGHDLLEGGLAPHRSAGEGGVPVPLNDDIERQEGQAPFAAQKEPVPDDFFERLARLVLELHARGVAYVDLNKPDNVLVGDDGRPYLVDFQISYLRPGRWNLVGRWLFRALCREDLYHVRKLKRKVRRDLMSPEELRESYRRSFLLSVHRRIAHPFQRLRRWALARLGAR